MFIRVTLGRAGSCTGTTLPRSRPWKTYVKNVPSEKHMHLAAISVKSQQNRRLSARRCCGGHTTGVAIARGIILPLATLGRVVSCTGITLTSSMRWKAYATFVPLRPNRQACQSAVVDAISGAVGIRGAIPPSKFEPHGHPCPIQRAIGSSLDCCAIRPTEHESQSKADGGL